MTVSEDLLEEAFLAYLKEVEAGHAPDRQEFLNRYPEVASELAGVLSVEQQVDTLFSPIRWIFGVEPTPPLASFGDYEVLGKIAKGGMGIVYRARQISLNRTVALKMIKNPQLANSTDLARFRLEAELVANLNHPHIVPVYEVGTKDNLPYFSMKLIEGGSLSDHIAEWTLPVVDARTRKDAAGKVWTRSELNDRQTRIALLVETAAQAVHHAHQRSLLHRDLKPGNILLDEAGQPHVTDFGLAKRLEDGQANETHDNGGTAPYMAPEQATANKDLTVRVDVHGLGTILYELLTGRAPFRGANLAETLAKVRDEQPEKPSQSRPYVARDLEAICLTCLQKDPHNRYASAEELAQDLHRFCEGRPIKYRPTPRWERAWMWMKRKPLVATLYSTLVLVTLFTLSSGTLQWLKTEKALRESLANLYAHSVVLAERDLSVGMVDRAEGLLDQRDQCPPELRDWEWNYLKRWCAGDCSAVVVNDSHIMEFAIDAERNAIITGDDNGAIRFWNGPDYKESVLLDQHKNKTAVSGLSLGNGGKLLAVAYHNNPAKVWDITTIKPDLRPRILGDKVGAVTVGRSDQRVAAAADEDKDKNVWVWDLATDAEPLRLDHKFQMISLAFSPEMKKPFLVTGGYGEEKLIHVWDLGAKPREEVLEFRHFGYSVGRVAVSPDGRWLAFSDGSSIGLRDLPREKNTLLHGGFNGRYVSIAFSPDSRLLVAATLAGSVTVWETSGKVVFSARRHSHIIPCIAFKPEDFSLVYVRGRQIINEPWRSPVGKPMRTLGDPAEQKLPRPVAFDAKNARYASADLDGVHVSSLGPEKIDVPLLECKESLTHLAFSADGTRLAGATKTGTVYQWETANGNVLKKLDTKQLSPRCLVLSKDGTHAAVASANNTVTVWDVLNGKDVFSSPFTQQVRCVAFSPDDRRLAVGGESGLLNVYDLQSKQEIAHLDKQSTLMMSVAFSQHDNGRYIAAGCWEGSVLLWDVNSRTVRAFGGRNSPAVASVHVSPNGKRIAAAGMDGVVRLWDTVSGQQVLTLPDQDAEITSLAFCGEEGSLLASANVRGVIKIWNGSPLEASR